MNNTTKKVNHPSVTSDLYKSVKVIEDFKAIGVRKGDVGVIVHASSYPEDLFEIQLHNDQMPITLPKWGLELIKPKV